MERLDVLTEMFGCINGHKGLIDLQYFWVSQDNDIHVLRMEVPWGAIPKDLHGKFLGYCHESIGAPKAIYVILEARCAKMNVDDEEYRKKVDEYRNIYGTLEGFNGVVDQAVMIGYDGENFHTKMVELNIDENEVRHFQGETVDIDSALGGVFSDNLIEGFHNTHIIADPTVEH